MTPNISYEQGLAHYKAGDYQLALTNFNEAIRDGHHPLEAAYYERSKCYEALLGQIDAAKADLAHMLTLSINETRRKQLTDLIALLDEAEIKPLSPPDTVPEGITAGFLTGLIIRIDDNVTLTVDNDVLKAIYAPGFLSEIPSVEVRRSAIDQIVCRREVTTNRLPRESYILLTANYTPIIQLGNYEQIRYIQWKLRNYLKLPDIRLSHEYVFARKKAIPPLGCKKSTSLGFIVGFLVLGLTILFPMDVDFKAVLFLVWLVLFTLYFVWVITADSAQQGLNDERITFAVVSYKNHRTWRRDGGIKHAYDVYYRYYGYEGKFTSEAVFNRLKVGDSIKISYLVHKPDVSKPIVKELP